MLEPVDSSLRFRPISYVHVYIIHNIHTLSTSPVLDFIWNFDGRCGYPINVTDILEDRAYVSGKIGSECGCLSRHRL